MRFVFLPIIACCVEICLAATRRVVLRFLCIFFKKKSVPTQYALPWVQRILKAVLHVIDGLRLKPMKTVAQAKTGKRMRYL